MLQIDWQGRRDVFRLVLSRETLGSLIDTFLSVADAQGIEAVCDESVEPAPGDLWVGCSPYRGWGDVHPDQVGWARAAEAYLVLAQLRYAAPSARPLVLSR